MTSSEILDTVSRLKIKLWVENGRLCFRAPKHVLTPELKEAIKNNKLELIDLLSEEGNSTLVSSNLSYNQQSLWFLHQLAPKSPAYNVAVACRIVSEIKPDALIRALEKLVEKYPILRTTYKYISGQDNVPCQNVKPTIDSFFVRINAKKWKDDDLKQRVEEYYQKPFDLKNGPVFRVHLFRLGALNHIFLLTVHHIACDAWSLNVLLDDLKCLYQAEIEGIELEQHSMITHYTDFITFQNKLLTGPEKDRLSVYWKEKLDGMAPSINLPTDFKRPSIQSFKGSSLFFTVKTPLYPQLMNFAKAQGVTLFTVILSVFQCLLMRLSQQNDILVGIPTAGRYKREFRQICGFFVNPIVIRGNVLGTLTFRELLKETSRTTLEALDHQEYPFPVLVDKLMPKREPGRSPIFQIMFNMLKRRTLGLAADFLCPAEDSNPVDFGPLQILPFPIKQQEGQYDLTLEIIDTDSFLFCCFKYCTDLFNSTTIKEMSEDFQTMLTTVMDNPECQLYTLPITKERKGKKGLVRDENIRNLVVAASFTPDILQSYLHYWMEKIKFDSKIVFAPYNQIYQQLLDPVSAFAANKKGINIILLKIDDWLKKHDKTGEKVSLEAIQDIKRNASELIRSVISFRAQSSVPLLILLCPSSPDILSIEDFKSLLSQTEHDLFEKFAKMNDVFAVHSSEILSAYPVKDYYEPLSDEIAHIPYSQPFFVSIATIISRKIFTINRKPFKAIVLDCDQTIWNGIIGEDGLNGINVDAGKKCFQEFILSQYEAGLLLCLCSKNSEQEVLNVFDNHPDMALKKEHFVSRRINWKPKSHNIKSIAKELNIGLESFIFIDDNPLECAEVRSNCPSVLTIELPDSGKDISRFIKNIWAFDHLTFTREDSNRSQFYKNAIEREKFHKESFSFSDFIQGLDLNVNISNLLTSQIPRVSQLTLRTNQFNLSTKQRSESEIKKIHETEDFFCYTVMVHDRFGDYGLVGVMMVERKKDSFIVDTFLLSCRALGRGVEHKMLAYLGAEARKLKLSTITFEYKPTKKNIPIYDFLTSPENKYEKKDASDLFIIPVSIASQTNLLNCLGSDSCFSDTNKRKQNHTKDLLPLSHDKSSGHLMEDIANVCYDSKSIIIAIERSKQIVLSLNGKQEIPTGNKVHSLPGSETEKRITSVWKDILEIDTINSNANFFDLGGRSILIPQIIIQLKKKFDIEIDIIDMLKFPTVQLLANHIDKNSDKSLSHKHTAHLAMKQKAALDRQRKRTQLARKII